MPNSCPQARGRDIKRNKSLRQSEKICDRLQARMHEIKPWNTPLNKDIEEEYKNNECKQKSWYAPFIMQYAENNNPILEIDVNQQKTLAALDTGSSQCLMSSYLAKKLFGKCYGLQTYNGPGVLDCQENLLEILGWKTVEMCIADKYYKYPVIIYKGGSKEMLIGLAFLRFFGLSVINGRGLGHVPKAEQCRRTKKEEQNVENTEIKEDLISEVKVIAERKIIVPAGRIQRIEALMILPEGYGNKTQMKYKGQEFYVSSEKMDDKEKLVQSYSVSRNGKHVFCYINNTGGFENKIIQGGETLGTAIRCKTVPVENVRRVFTNEVIKTLKEEISDSARRILNKEVWEHKQNEETVKIENTPKGYDKNTVYKNEEFNIYNPDKKFISEVNKLAVKFPKLWSKAKYETGCYVDENGKEVLHSVPLKEDAKPHQETPRKLHPKLVERAKHVLKELEQYEIIERGYGKWSNCAVWVLKQDEATQSELEKGQVPGTKKKVPDHLKELRLCVDYKTSNNYFEKQGFQLSPMKQILQSFREAEIISVCDITSSFYHLKLDQEAQEIFCFSDGMDCNWKFLRAPMGYKNSPSILLSSLSETLAPLAPHVTFYSDNLILQSQKKADHLKLLERFFELMERRGWKLRKSKCHLGIIDKANIFSFEVDLKNKCISPSKQKVDAIQKIEYPKTKTELKSFIGAVTYFVTFFAGRLHEEMAVLTEATKEMKDTDGNNDKKKFSFGLDEKKAFDAVKHELSLIPRLHFLNPNIIPTVVIDSSFQSCGGFLGQYVKEKGKYVPIEFLSKKFAERERKFSQYHRELIGLIYATTYWDHILRYQEYEIISDCKALTYLLIHQDKSSKLARYSMLLAEYSFTVVWLPKERAEIVFADFLSRRETGREGGERLAVKHDEVLLKMEMERIFDSRYRLNMEDFRARVAKEYKRVSETGIGHTEQCRRTLQEFEEVLYIPTPEDYARKNVTKKRHYFSMIDKQIAGEYSSDKTPSGRNLDCIVKLNLNIGLDILRKEQRKDNNYGEIMSQLENKINGPWMNERGYFMKNGILLMEIAKEDRYGNTIYDYKLPIPERITYNVCQEIHYRLAHPGKNKMLSIIKSNFVCQNITYHVEEVLKNCLQCTLTKVSTIPKRNLGPGAAFTAQRPGDVWSTDLLHVTKEIQICVFIDTFSKFVVLTRCSKTVKTDEFIEIFLKKVTAIFGNPRIGFVSDNQTSCFANKAMGKLCCILDVRRFFTTKLNPRANLAELANKIIVKSMRIYKQLYRKDINERMTECLLQFIASCHNQTNLAGLEVTPFEAMFGRQPPQENMLYNYGNLEKTYKDNVRSFTHDILVCQSIAGDLLQKRKDLIEKQKKMMQKTRKRQVSIGDFITVKKDKNDKLETNYKGLYRVTKVNATSVECVNYKKLMMQSHNKYVRQAPEVTWKTDRYDKDQIKIVYLTAFLSESIAEEIVKKYRKNGKNNWMLYTRKPSENIQSNEEREVSSESEDDDSEDDKEEDPDNHLGEIQIALENNDHEDNQEGNIEDNGINENEDIQEQLDPVEQRENQQVTIQAEVHEVPTHRVGPRRSERGQTTQNKKNGRKKDPAAQETQSSRNPFFRGVRDLAGKRNSKK